jgi:crossover junction endodeoxyribonuclease RuvC
MRVLGIDPGYDRLGWGVVEGDWRSPKYAASGLISTDRADDAETRLAKIADDTRRLIKKVKPDAVAVEEIYFAKNVKTAIGVAQARGVVMAVAGQAGVPVAEYAPVVIKQDITGNGSAAKTQVQYMIRQILKVDNDRAGDDEFDAIAAALCHFYRAGGRR